MNQKCLNSIFEYANFEIYFGHKNINYLNVNEKYLYFCIRHIATNSVAGSVEIPAIFKKTKNYRPLLSHMIRLFEITVTRNVQMDGMIHARKIIEKLALNQREAEGTSPQTR